MEPENRGALSFYRRKRFQCLMAFLGAAVFLIGVVVHLLNVNRATSIFLLCFGLGLICIACVICLFRKEGSDVRQGVFPEVSAMAYGSVYSRPSSSRHVIPTICGSASSNRNSATPNLYCPTPTAVPPPAYDKAIYMESPPPLRGPQDDEFSYPPPYWKLTPESTSNTAVDSVQDYTIQEPLKVGNHATIT